MNTCTCINECSLCLSDIGCLSIEGSTQNTTVVNPLLSSGKIYEHMYMYQWMFLVLNRYWLFKY